MSSEETTQQETRQDAEDEAFRRRQEDDLHNALDEALGEVLHDLDYEDTNFETAISNHVEQAKNELKQARRLRSAEISEEVLHR